MSMFLAYTCAQPPAVQVGFSLAMQADQIGVTAKLTGSFAAVLWVDIFDQPAVAVTCQVSIRHSSWGSIENAGD